MSAQENILGIRDVGSNNNDDRRKKRVIEKLSTRGKRATPAKRKASPKPLSREEQQQREERRLARQAALAESSKRINVGIDFGTTFSGIAYVSSSSETHEKTAKDVEVITKWTGGQNDLLEKVPTRIAYASENSDLDSDLWGYDVKPGSMISCQWFKLLLDAKQYPSDYDDPLLVKCSGQGLFHLPAGKRPEDVAADYLRCLYMHCIGQLNSLMGHVAVLHTPIRFELTTPATWSFAARDATRQAATDAGFGSREQDDVVLIDEPEAAAISAMKSSIEAFPNNDIFQRGQSVLICDLGGGTCDFTTYRIAKVSPLKLEEACVGEGGKCGSTSIDRAFWEFLGEKFGEAFKSLSAKKTASGSPLMSAFEDIKRDFKGPDGESKTYEAPLKMKLKLEDNKQLARYYDDEEDLVKFTSEDLQKMFEPTLVRIFDLVWEQIKRTKQAKMPAPRTLVLVGGLGSSPYVKSRFKQFVEEKLNGKADIISPQRPWSAIARGAAIRALEKPCVQFRRARDHIGIQVHENFDPEKHRKEDYFECPIEGARAKHQMRWSVERGEKIKPNMKNVINAYIAIEGIKRKGEILVYQDFYSCMAKDAPTRFDETCNKAGKIKMDLTNIVREEQRKYPAGKAPQRINFDVKIELTCGSDKGILEATAKVGMKKVGTCQIVYYSDPSSGA